MPLRESQVNLFFLSFLLLRAGGTNALRAKHPSQNFYFLFWQEKKETKGRRQSEIGKGTFPSFVKAIGTKGSLLLKKMASLSSSIILLEVKACAFLEVVATSPLIQDEALVIVIFIRFLEYPLGLGHQRRILILINMMRTRVLLVVI